MSDIREAFERWSAEKFPYMKLTRKGDTGDYLYKTADFAWMAWQAARTQAPKMSRIAQNKIEQMGGDVCGVLVRTEGGVMAVSEHGRCTRLDAGVMGPVETEARESLFSERDLFLMKEAMNAGQYYESLGDWLGEVISDGGHTVEQHLAHDADQKQAACAQGDVVAVHVAALEYLKDQWPGAYAKLYERICSNKNPQPPKQEGE